MITMENISRPRSFAKTAAIAAITLLAAGCVTAVGIGMEGMLWQTRTAVAEGHKAEALMAEAIAEKEKAKAQMKQAEATVAAAGQQATAIMESARTTATAVGNHLKT
jgi:hypothetical protein